MIVDLEPRTPETGELERRALIVGGGASVLGLIGLFVSPEAFFENYLFAYLFWIGIALGSLAFLMIHHLAGGRWSGVLRPLWEPATRTLPLLALLFLPLLLGIDSLYEWSHPEVVAEDPFLQHKEIYLNVPFWLLRAALFFGIWIGLSILLNRWGREQDDERDPSVSARLKSVSVVGMILFGLTFTFASVDWIMSLEPHWFSSIYGLLLGVGAALAAFAFVVALFIRLAREEPLRTLVSARLFNDLGSLLLSLTMLWAYAAFSQFLLIWSGNLPEEITWYLRRLDGGWEWIAVALLLFHFALPFFLLLNRDLKRNPDRLLVVAGLLLAMRLLDAYWLVIPAHHPTFHVHWLTLVLPVAIGGLWLWMYARELGRQPLIALQDPKVRAALAQGERAGIIVTDKGGTEGTHVT